MLYYLFPEDSHRPPFARSYTAAERAGLSAQNIPIYVLPDVMRRTSISEGISSLSGVLPLAGAESDR